VLPIEKAEAFSENDEVFSEVESQMDLNEPESKALLKEGSIVQIAWWKGHNDIIKCVKYIE